MLNYVQGDLFQHVAETTNPIIIPHVCNNIGAWGAGFVIPLAKAYPIARDDYISRRKDLDYGYLLGHTHFVEATERVDVANMIAQHGTGGIRPLRYNSLAKCLDAVADHALAYIQEIHAPLFGSGLAGGNWLFIEEMIKDAWVDRGINVTIYYLPNSIPSNWTPPSV